MRYVFLVFQIAILLAIAGCSNEDQLKSISDNSNKNSERSIRSLENALSNADRWFNEMDSLNGTRSHVKRSVRSVEVFTTDSPTRAGSVDTLLYLVNYDEDGGFALLGAPYASEDIYAISEQGKLEIADTVFNKGLQLFIEDAENDAYYSANSTSIDFNYVYGIKRRGMAALPENVSKWNQTSPFNKYCPLINVQRGYVGCGAVAAGMLMAYYRWPDKIEESYVDWNSIVDANSYDAIAKFLETIAGSNYLDSWYSHPESSLSRSTYSSSFKPAFSNCGYSVSQCWNFMGFNDNRKVVFDFIKDGIYSAYDKAPLIMFGSRTTEEGKYAGHFWIVDGFVERIKSVGNSPITSEADPLLHMIWGWGGAGNGYYLYKLSDKTIDVEQYDGNYKTMPYTNLSVFGRIQK